MSATNQQAVATIDVLGRQLDISSALPEIIEYAREAWGFSEHSSAPQPYRISVTPAASALPSLSGETVSVRAFQLQVPLTVSGQELCFSLPEAAPQRQEVALRASVDLAGTSIVVAPNVPFTPLLRAALQVIVAEGLRLSGLLPLHAAVAARHEEVCAFVGPSGRGKSTTLVRALQAGWLALAEDFAWLDPATACVYGWDRGLRLLPESLALLAVPAPAEGWPLLPDGKHWLTFESLRGVGFTVEPQARTLTRLALLERRPEAPSGWEALDRRRALRALWEATGLAVTPLAQQRSGVQLAQLLAQLECLTLVLGNTPPL